MTLRQLQLVFAIASAAFLSLGQPVLAEPPPDSAQIEIDHLLSSVEHSGCEFYRNGRWYDAARAEKHLRQKYDYLVARSRIHAAEDFIDLAATASSLSGRPYKVRCGGTEEVTSSEWLRNLLGAYRTPPGG